MSNIPLDLISAFLFFLLGIGVTKALAWWRNRRPAARVWSIAPDERVEIVITTAPVSHDLEGTMLTYPSEAVAAGDIYAYLADVLQADCRLRLSESFPSNKWDESLVVIGGPVHNRITRCLLDEIAPSVRFEGHECVAPDGARYEAETKPGSGHLEEFVSDVGVIVRAPNPFADGKLVTLLMGSRTLGCLIAARYLLHAQVQEAASAIPASDSFELIVRAKVIDGVPRGIDLVGVW